MKSPVCVVLESSSVTSVCKIEASCHSSSAAGSSDASVLRVLPYSILYSSGLLFANKRLKLGREQN